MRVYVKGMEMPTTCRDCRLSTFADFDSMPFCNITMDDICLNDWETKRCDNCPLVPVPPHGDLISRETAKLYHSYLVDERTDIRVPAIPLSVLNVIPTIIPAEEGE